jgi:hypothetical protein
VFASILQASLLPRTDARLVARLAQSSPHLPALAASSGSRLPSLYPAKNADSGSGTAAASQSRSPPQLEDRNRAAEAAADAAANRAATAVRKQLLFATGKISNEGKVRLRRALNV